MFSYLHASRSDLCCRQTKENLRTTDVNASFFWILRACDVIRGWAAFSIDILAQVAASVSKISIYVLTFKFDYLASLFLREGKYSSTNYNSVLTFFGTLSSPSSPSTVRGSVQ
jgi:hypothetical protein